MTPDEIAAVSRISPTAAPYIVASVSLLGGLTALMVTLPRMTVLRSLVMRITGWDPGAVPEDEASRRTMALMDQLQEELARCRIMIERYGVEIDQLRQARLCLLSNVVELRDAAIAARALVHQLQRQSGFPETAFEPLPGSAPGAAP